GDEGWSASPHTEPREPGSRVRSRLHSRNGAALAYRMGGVQLHCVREQEFRAGPAQPELTLANVAKRYNHRSTFQSSRSAQTAFEWWSLRMRKRCVVAVMMLSLAAGSFARQQSSKSKKTQQQTEPAAPQEKAGKPPAPAPKPEE